MKEATKRNTDLLPSVGHGTDRLVTRGPPAWFEEMDRWFEDLRRGLGFGVWSDFSPSTADLRTRLPAVDLADDDQEYVVKADLPGVSREDVDVRVDTDGIEIRAVTSTETEETKQDLIHRERSCSSFHRTLPFPAEVLADRAAASLKDGILEVRGPKKEPAAKREPIKVRVE